MGTLFVPARRSQHRKEPHMRKTGLLVYTAVAQDNGRKERKLQGRWVIFSEGLSWELALKYKKNPTYE